ncbi:hypothetical protein M9H77_19579 [Catharanthus roseus]|uniref:Uncharacterized protein n=1 Tax=Catharanthus roseus TaxID=4058 RepID=A0ACC0BAQ6_CATRO|nr:hypothetical protein M9H77_19579 [Catharanthus roseus]
MDDDLVQEDIDRNVVEREETSGGGTRSKRPASEDEGVLDGVNDELSYGVSDSKDETVEFRDGYKNFNAEREGLNAALTNVLPNSEQRFCVQYVHMNFKNLHKGKALKDLLWKISRSSNEALYVFAIKELEEYDKDAHML